MYTYLQKKNYKVKQKINNTENNISQQKYILKTKNRIKWVKRVAKKDKITKQLNSLDYIITDILWILNNEFYSSLFALLLHH